MQKFIKPLACLLLLSLLFSACQKDLSPISISKWHPNIAVPLFSTQVTLSDVIGNDSSLIKQSDSLLVFVYNQDSVFIINADSLLQFNNQASYNFSFSLGVLRMGDFEITDSISITNLLSEMQTNVADSLRKYDGQQNVFPPFSLNEIYTLSLPVVDNYRQLSFSSGSFTLNTQNNLPVIVDTLFYDLIDINRGTTLKSVKLFNIAPGTNKSINIDLKGKVVSNNLKVNLIKLSSQGSNPNNVQINLSKGLSFRFQATNLQVVSGTAKIPQQNVFSEQRWINLGFQNGEKIYNLLFKLGNIDYDIHSGLPTEVSVHMDLPTGSINGSTPSKDVNITSNSNARGSWDLGNTSIDLTTNTTIPFNQFPVTFTSTMSSGNQMVTFNSSDPITTSFSINNLTIASAQGYLGQRSFTFDPDSITLDLDFLKQLKGNLILNDPKIILHYQNGLGIPIQMNLNFTAINSENESQQDLNLDPISFQYPGTIGQSVSGQISIDKNNSSIVDFLSLRPDLINYSGNALINPDGKTTNFITDSVGFIANAEIRIPLALQADHLTFSDTINDIRISKDNIPIQSGSILAVVSNGFPLEIKMQLSFPDSITGQTLTTLNFGTIASASVDNTGKVSSAGQSKINITISEDFLNKVKKANSAIIHLETSTFNNGTVPVQLYSDYKFGVSVGFSATLTP